jgi:dTDP-4-amino-4,6-dideoxygalactose transaminase
MDNFIYLSPPHLSGKEGHYIQKALDSNWVTTTGENILTFEKAIREFTGAKHAVALNSGTAALHLALILAGVGPGDEVLCATFTFAATANPIRYQQALPVFIDSEPESWNICPLTTQRAIEDRLAKGKKPKALMAVHLYGQPANMPALRELATEYEMVLIEDAAEALGSAIGPHQAGTLGDFGILSFNGNKIITTSGGGMLLTNDKDHALRALYLATQAREAQPFYHHLEIGYNYRMSNVSAGIGLGQAEVLLERISQKQKVFHWYERVLGTSGWVSFQPQAKGTFSNRWLTAICLEQGLDPERLRQALLARNIECRRLWKPLHLQPVFQDCPYYDNGDVSAAIFKQGLCLPSGTALTDKQLDYICKAIFLGIG